VPALHGDWAFALKFGELWAIPVSGGAAVQVARFNDRGDQTAWPYSLPANELRRQLTPDGRSLALSIGEDVAGGGGPRYRLALVDLEHGKLVQVVRDDADLIRPAISPDGTKIAYVRRMPTTSDRPLVDDGLWVVNADGTGTRRVAPGADGLFTWIFGWTPDSKGIVFDLLEWSAGPVVIDVASGERRLLGGFVPRMWMTYGNDFAFRSNRSPSLVAGLSSRAFQGEYSLVVADRAGDPQRTLVAEDNTFFLLGAPRWNPKSDEILYRHLIKPDQSEFFIGTGIVYLFQGVAQGTDYFLATGVRTARRDGSGDRELFSLPGLSDLVVVGYP